MKSLPPKLTGRLCPHYCVAFREVRFLQTFMVAMPTPRLHTLDPRSGFSHYLISADHACPSAVDIVECWLKSGTRMKDAAKRMLGFPATCFSASRGDASKSHNIIKCRTRHAARWILKQQILTAKAISPVVASMEVSSFVKLPDIYRPSGVSFPCMLELESSIDRSNSRLSGKAKH